MAERRRICVVTGSRAEFGLLHWVLREIEAEASLALQLIATGMHLSPEYGMTVKQIEAEGFRVDRRVDMLLSSNTPGGVAKSIGLGVIGLSDALESLAPDAVLVLGDRFEILAVAQVCLVHKIPLVHLAGGDVSEGAFDESIRHAITKMAHLHLVTNEQAAARVRQMGEEPWRVHVVGSPGLDHLRRQTLLEGAALEQALGAPLGRHNLLVTFHPVTLAEDEGRGEFAELLAALDTLGEDTVIWFTRPNADTGSHALNALLDRWAADRSSRVRVHTSLGQLRYLSLMAQVDAVVGNSSSGLYEAPSFHVPTVNVGDRQKGRLAASSVIHCAPAREAIIQALARAQALDTQDTVNPYGDGRSAPRIVALLRELPTRARLLHKSFCTMAGAA